MKQIKLSGKSFGGTSLSGRSKTRRLRRVLAGSVLSVGIVAGSHSVLAQSESQAPSRTAMLDLPDAPGESSSAQNSQGNQGQADQGQKMDKLRLRPLHPPPIAPLYNKYIEPGQTAQPLATGDKILFGLHQLVSPYLLLSVVTAAGYEQAVNGSPNYGTNIGAYGQRVGAAAIRDATQTIFTDSVMSAALHEDPRYYVMGKRRNAVVRAGYAVTRVLVTRDDNGGLTPNYALFSGYAGAAALTNAYYPDVNHGFSETAKSYGGSLGGAAVSNVVREFLPDLLHVAHLE